MGIVVTFTTTDIILIIGAVSLAIQQIILAARSSRKLDVIAGHVNGASSAQAAKVDALTLRVETLTAALAERKETAAVLAATTTTVAVKKEG